MFMWWINPELNINKSTLIVPNALFNVINDSIIDYLKNLRKNSELIYFQLEFAVVHHIRIPQWWFRSLNTHGLNRLLAKGKNAEFVVCGFGRDVRHNHNNSNYLHLFILVIFIFGRRNSCSAWSLSRTAETNNARSPKLSRGTRQVHFS